MAGQIQQMMYDLSTEEGRAKVNETLAVLNGTGVLPSSCELRVVEVDRLVEQKINPRSMPQRMFDQLINNIKEAGGLESVPLCAEVEGQIHIISGHHRTRAARASGQKYLLALVYTELDADRIRSKQLAHNSIDGRDDPELIKQVFQQITDIQAQFEAFIDPRIFNGIPDPVSFKPVDVSMQDAAKTVVIVFLDTQFKEYKGAVEAVMPSVSPDTIYLAGRDAYDGWKTALSRVREECDIVSIPAAAAYMATLAIERLNQLEAEREQGSDAE